MNRVVPVPESSRKYTVQSLVSQKTNGTRRFADRKVSSRRAESQPNHRGAARPGQDSRTSNPRVPGSWHRALLLSHATVAIGRGPPAAAPAAATPVAAAAAPVAAAAPIAAPPPIVLPISAPSAVAIAIGRVEIRGDVVRLQLLAHLRTLVARLDDHTREGMVEAEGLGVGGDGVVDVGRGRVGIHLAHVPGHTPTLSLGGHGCSGKGRQCVSRAVAAPLR